MSMNYLLLYSDQEEPVTQALLQSNHKDLLALSIQNFLAEVEVFDQIIDGQPQLYWKRLGCEIDIERSFLINRVVSVGEELFDHFCPEDRSYAVAEFRAYLTFALEAFPKAFGRPGVGGFFGDIFSLPEQWKRVSKMNISVPDYYIGSKGNPFEGHERAVHSNPYHYYHWRPGKESLFSSFSFLRPIGEPIAFSVIGKQVYPFSPLGKKRKVKASPSSIESCKSQALKLADLFCLDIAEMLFFVDSEEGITFGMVSPIPHASRSQPHFNLAVVNSIFGMGAFDD